LQLINNVRKTIRKSARKPQLKIRQQIDNEQIVSFGLRRGRGEKMVTQVSELSTLSSSHFGASNQKGMKKNNEKKNVFSDGRTF